MLKKIIKYSIMGLQLSVARLYCLYTQVKGKFCKDIINKPYEIVYVPVKLINRKVRFKNSRVIKIGEAKIVRMVGKILNSDWDFQVNEKSIDSMNFYIGFKERFLEGKQWEATLYYQDFIEGSMFKKTKITWNEFKEVNCKRWDKLYQEIKEHGYKKQNKTLSFNKPYSISKGTSEGEIQVGVSRSGEILFIDGHHRLAIAKILNIEEVPVIVNYWHKTYIDKVITKKGNKINPAIAIKPALEYFSDTHKQHENRQPVQKEA